jgi:hypothetical protein
MNAQRADCPIPHPPDPQSREARHHPLSRSGGGGGGLTACHGPIRWAPSSSAWLETRKRQRLPRRMAATIRASTRARISLHA